MHISKKQGTGIVVGVLFVVAIVSFVMPRLSDGRDGGTVSPDENIEVFDSPSVDVGSVNDNLPFRIVGVDSVAPVYEISEISQEAPLDVAWSFGGDFSRIGSFPLSKDSVFGSFSKRPDNLSSYRPAFIGPQGEDAIAPLSKDPYYEPRDGSGTVDGVTWYSSTLSNAYDTTINNWQLGVWDRKSDSSHVLASAQELNDTAETPALPGEVVPTMNGDKVYYASNVRRGDEWVPSVLECNVDGSGDCRVIAPGSFPAAIADGVLYATDFVDDGTTGTGYSAVALHDGSISNVLTVDSAVSGWCVSGIWASEGLRVVSFSNSVENQGCYLGFWTADFKECTTWVHTSSPSVVGSVSLSGFAWGAGSQEENAQMYLLDVSRPDEALLLGEAPGYSRPSISADGSTVLVPVYNGMSAVKFDVVTLS